MDSIAVIKNMVQEAEDHAEETGQDRIRATEYYRGIMRDVPSDEGRSKMVTRDVRAYVKKILPSIVRTIFGSSQVVEYLPVGENDQEGAEQATDYINHVVFPECDGEQVVYDAIHDALLLRNGLLKWWWEEKQEVSFSRHTGLDDMALATLVNDDDVEVIEHSSYEEQTDLGSVLLHDLKIKRMRVKRAPRIAAVPRENFLIHPDAISIDDSLIVGDVNQIRRSDLLLMGYDAGLVDSLPATGEVDSEEQTRRDEAIDKTEEQRANDQIDYYDLFVRVDRDGDGVSELRHMVFAGSIDERYLLVDDEVDDVQFADLTAMRQPHQWEGVSIFDDVEDIMKVKTVLLRQTLDNIYWQNNPQPIMQDGVFVDPEAIFNPEFGKPATVRQGVDVRTALTFNQVPLVAKDSFSMIDYIDTEAQARTGINEASSGLAPDALQNMTAKASAMIEQAGIGQTEMMVRTIASGLRVFFRGLLRLTIRHQDVPRTVRLRDEWVTFDPRQWNADMDATVNVGLGAGTRERDMAMMQQVIGLQEKMLMSMGPNNPYVKPENLWNSISRMVESAGLKDPRLYFTEPDPDEVAKLLKDQANKPDPETMKVQAQMQLEQAKAQAKIEGEKAKMQVQRDKERAQMEADLATESQKLAFEREKLDRQAAIESAKLAQQREIELLKLGAKDGESGVVTMDDERNTAFVQAMGEMMTMLREMSNAQTRPKRVVRDENGDVIGVETFNPMVN